jgi:hypothetical protein
MLYLCQVMSSMQFICKSNKNKCCPVFYNLDDDATAIKIISNQGPFAIFPVIYSPWGTTFLWVTFLDALCWRASEKISRAQRDSSLSEVAFEFQFYKIFSKEREITRLDIMAYLDTASNPGSKPKRFSVKNCKSSTSDKLQTFKTIFGISYKFLAKNSI